MTAKQKLICPPKHPWDTPTFSTFDKFISTNLACLDNKHLHENYHTPLPQPAQGREHGQGVRSRNVYFCVHLDKPHLDDLYGKSPQDALAKSITKLGEIQRGKAGRTRELLCEWRERVLQRRDGRGEHFTAS